MDSYLEREHDRAFSVGLKAHLGAFGPRYS